MYVLVLFPMVMLVWRLEMLLGLRLLFVTVAVEDNLTR
jgi:hypothetical protein